MIVSNYPGREARAGWMTAENGNEIFFFDSNDAQFPHYSSPYTELEFSDWITQSPLK
jgi:hypothetical protein